MLLASTNIDFKVFVAPEGNTIKQFSPKPVFVRRGSHKREGDFVVTAGEKLEAFIFLYRSQALPHFSHKKRLFQNED